MGLRLQDWLLLTAAILAALFYSVRKRRYGRIRGKKPRQSDSRVIQILEEAGYDILQVKPAVKVDMEIEQKVYPFELKNDFLVSRHGRRYLVRVRRDGKPLRLQSKMWRNSLLRDVLASRTAGILILDVEKNSLQQVHFRI